jgi:uncharacterized membrane protein
MSKQPTRARRIVSDVFQGAFYLGYPLIVYFAYTRLGVRALAAFLLALYGISIALRLRSSATELRRLLRQHLGLALLIGVALGTGDPSALLFLPVIVSLYLLWTFSMSLRNGAPMIERFARMVEDDLPDFTRPYCRKVTIVWCFFLAANALCVAILAAKAPLEWWAAYTGLISYLLVGALIAGEFIVHKVWFRYFGNSLLDRVLARTFPPQRTANGRRSLAYQEQRQRGEITRSSA